MAHELTINAGVAEMAYVGETPWHGLGQQLAEGASIETWQQAAGMAWEIDASSVQYISRTGATHTDDANVVLHRSDNAMPLGLVSPDYCLVQPKEVLEFFRDLTTDHGFNLHTAGTLFGGRRFWALAKVADTKIAGWDEVGGYLLLSTSADGSTATEARLTSVRVVCNNTLSLATASGAGAIKISHRSAFDSKAVKRQLGMSKEHFASFAETANALSKVKVSDAAAINFVSGLLNVDPEHMVRKPKGWDTILGLFDGAGEGSTRPGSQGTAWGLVNAVTEYVDHFSASKSPSHHLQKIWMGDGDKLKSEALGNAIEYWL